MARIFSINFTYNEQTYGALISVRITPFFTEYHINMLEDELLNELPEKRIIAGSNGLLSFPDVRMENETGLMVTIRKAVSDYLHTVPV